MVQCYDEVKPQISLNTDEYVLLLYLIMKYRSILGKASIIFAQVFLTYTQFLYLSRTYTAVLFLRIHAIMEGMDALNNYNSILSLQTLFLY